jgi:hypothetical protein
MKQLGSHWTDFHEIWYFTIFRKSDKYNVRVLYMQQTDRPVHFWSHLAHFCLESEVFKTKIVEKIETHNLCSAAFFENRAVCVTMWGNIVEPEKPQMTVWRMRIACWTTKSINTHSEYVIHIALPLQQWLRERSPMLRYTYSARHVRHYSRHYVLYWLTRGSLWTQRG